MIAGKLKIKEPTVKLHTSNLYKKLGINSRAELFLLFGVTNIPDEE
jgi:DNA-binding NarL/FixJ family response regulator